MFSLIHGNRQDILAKLLASRLSSDPPALFAEELVVEEVLLEMLLEYRQQQ